MIFRRLIPAFGIALCVLLPPNFAFPQENESSRIEQLEAEVAELKKLLKEAIADKGGETETERIEEAAELVSGSRLRYYEVTPASYQTIQKGDPIEPGFVDLGNNFVVGNFLATDASKIFERKHVGVLWDGYLQIEEAGKHMFAAQSSRTQYYHSYLSVSINGKRLIATTSKNEPEIATIQIDAPGLYYVEVWLSPSKTRVDTQNTVSASVEFKSSSASRFETLSPGSLYTEKPKK